MENFGRSFSISGRKCPYPVGYINPRCAQISHVALLLLLVDRVYALVGQEDAATEQAVFALSQLPEDVAGPSLLALARDSTLPREARRQALFWLAHEGDEESLAQLVELLVH